MQTLLIASAVFVMGMAALRVLACLLPLQKTKAHIRFAVYPRYTVLVPLYREAHMVEALCGHLRAIDYPADRLDIILITEADDVQTTQAARAFAGAQIRVHAVPPSLPRTKPKAMNHALAAMPVDEIGDIITIYDAEDRPHPGQLKQAAQSFAANPELAAVQAPLRIDNIRASMLSAMFALEYAALFYVWNPAMARLGLPFPLGGTSNHIRKSALLAAGGWDANNVTEDADLAFRISALTPTTKLGCISRPTGEEAVATLKDWHNQRARWLKGFMQTWRVHMRRKTAAPNGGRVHAKAKAKTFLSLQITLGATLLAAFLHVPSILVLNGMFAADILGAVDGVWKLSLLIVLCSGYGAAMLLGVMGAVRARQAYLLWFVPLMPFYWLLYFWPALLAAYDIIVRPSHWRKTAHIGRPKTGQDTEINSAAPPCTSVKNTQFVSNT